MFSSAEAELNAFHNFDAPDLYYQYYPDIYPGKKGVCGSQVFQFVFYCFSFLKNIF